MFQVTSPAIGSAWPITPPGSNETAASILKVAMKCAKCLEKLKGERDGQYSIRVNDQWRVCFRWTESGAEDVEIVDYH